MRKHLTFLAVVALLASSFIATECTAKTKEEKIAENKQKLSDQDSTVRKNAVKELGKLRAKEARADLENVLLNDSDPKVRRSAARALNFIGDKQAVPSLIQAMSDSHKGTSFAAIDALGSLKDAQAVNALLDGLESEDVSIRRSCISALNLATQNPNPAIKRAAKHALKKIL